LIWRNDAGLIRHILAKATIGSRTMDIKLTMLFVIIGSIVGFSRGGDETMTPRLQWARARLIAGMGRHGER
jgi:hypothetical protein